LHLGKESRVSDVMLAVGPALATLAGGVGVADMTTTVPLTLAGWVVGSSIAAGAVGLLMTGAGVALKFR
jgi:hypothetical protein